MERDIEINYFKLELSVEIRQEAPYFTLREAGGAPFSYKGGALFSHKGGRTHIHKR